MIDKITYEKIIGGETIMLKTTGTEDRIIGLIMWLQQFKPMISVNVYPKQKRTMITLWIHGLPNDFRSLLVASTLKSDPLSFKANNSDSS